MHIVEAKKITEEVKRMAIEAAYYLPQDVLTSLKMSREAEKWSLARDTLDQIIENADIAKRTNSPMCQDTGMAVIFVTIGQDVHIEGGYIEDAINEGVRQGYTEGYLRKSVVKKFILETVERAGPNPCPPIVGGVGIGGTVDKVTLIAKKALMRPMDSYNPDPFYADLEKEMLEKVNALGIGPQGYGGKTTALRVLIETYPTHIAGLPICVNINCHATRHKEVTL